MSKQELIEQYYNRIYNKNPNIKNTVEEKKVLEFINRYFGVTKAPAKKEKATT